MRTNRFRFNCQSKDTHNYSVNMSHIVHIVYRTILLLLVYRSLLRPLLLLDRRFAFGLELSVSAPRASDVRMTSSANINTATAN